MTTDLAKKIMKRLIRSGFTYDGGYGQEDLSEDEKEALDMAIKSLEKIEHLKDRPCSACEFHSDNGCSKWNCVFEK